jgi:hypothetical protein
MSLVGQKPAPSRTDGFWVKQIDDPSISEEPIMPKDIETLAAWGRLLLSASQPFEVQRQSLQKQTQAEHDAINTKSDQAQTAIRRKEKESFHSIAEDPAQKETLDYLRSRSFDSKRTIKATGDVRRHLEAQKQLSSAEINRIMSLLTRYPPSATTNQPPLRPKTDPLIHSVDVIKKME